MNLTLHIYMVPDSTEEQGFRIRLIQSDMAYWADDDHIKIGEHELDLDLTIPSQQELQVMAIDSLKDKQEAIMKQAVERKQELQVKIDNLLMLEYQP